MRDYEAVRADEAIQYAPVAVEPPSPPPDWLLKLQEFLGRMVASVADFFGASWPVMKWVLIAAAAAALVFVIVRMFELRAPRTPREDEDTPEWTPDRAQALALLEDADRLAGEGRYDEAVHLLLQRSVGHIAAARPEWLDPSSTAREITRLPGLPDAARRAFSAIAERVERSLFALRSLDAQDWTVARAAYSDFALQRFERGAA